jgi:hypothetical protein
LFVYLFICLFVILFFLELIARQLCIFCREQQQWILCNKIYWPQQRLQVCPTCPYLHFKAGSNAHVGLWLDFFFFSFSAGHFMSGLDTRGSFNPVASVTTPAPVPVLAPTAVPVSTQSALVRPPSNRSSGPDRAKAGVRPIILVPPANSTLLNLLNVRDFLEDERLGIAFQHSLHSCCRHSDEIFFFFFFVFQIYSHSNQSG